jgi:hypothetical protein
MFWNWATVGANRLESAHFHTGGGQLIAYSGRFIKFLTPIRESAAANIQVEDGVAQIAGK